MQDYGFKYPRKYIAEVRRAKHIKVRELCRVLNLNEDEYNDFEKGIGRFDLPAPDIYRICKYLGIDTKLAIKKEKLIRLVRRM